MIGWFWGKRVSNSAIGRGEISLGRRLLWDAVNPVFITRVLYRCRGELVFGREGEHRMPAEISSSRKIMWKMVPLVW